MTSRDYFDVLGVRRAYHLQKAALEAQFLARQKELHPDRAAAGARLAAVVATTELNDAYRVLKDDVRRAEYLLKLEGLDIGDERSAVKAAPSLLMEMMELNEELAEARAAGDAARVGGLAGRVRALHAAALATVGEKFAEYERGERGGLAAVAQALIAMRYHARFLEQVDAFEEARAEAGL